jgi:hypothetical protein
MESQCHRCGNSLREGEAFCPHCGAPQFVVEAVEPGAPAQPALRLQSETQRVQWRAAIVSALVMAVPLGVFSSLFATSLIVLIVVALVGGLTVWLYQRRSAGWVDGRMGWRIGSILGAAAAFLACGSWALRMVIERYLMHGGPTIDAEYLAYAHQLLDTWNKASAQQGTPSAAQLVQQLSGFVLSPDGHAALQLMTAVTMSVGILLFAALGGALGGWWQSTRARTQRSL